MGTKLPLVSICCITYNHEKYIRDAIEGFLMQKTTFPVEILIHDDASTDKTAQIVKEYAENHSDLIITIFQTENQYSQGIKPWPNFVFPRARGKYIALCDGDDYWTDPLKLQKQVDFLEENEEYSLCVGGFEKINVYTNETKKIIKKISDVEENDKGYTFTLNDTKKGWITKTLTAVFRNDKNIFNQFTKYKYGRDINLFYHILKRGKGFYFTELMGVYRIHEGGVNSMKHGKINSNTAYQVYKELYHYNKDEFSRHMNVKHTLALLNYNLFNNYPGNTLIKKFQLYFEAIILVRNFKEFIFLFTVFVPAEIKSKLRK